jgi:hypothetical protein
MVVELLTRIVLVNVLTTSFKIINRVLDRPDTSRRRMLSNTNRISQTPANEMAFKKVEWCISGAYLGNIIAANLRMPTGDIASGGVLVGVAAAGDEKRARLFLGYEQRASGVIRVAHVSNEGDIRREVDGDGLAVVGERKDAFG